MSDIIFDIETGPESDEVIDLFFHYDETSVPGYHMIGKEFDPASVKTGNTKDPIKIEEKINSAREKFLDDQKAAEMALTNGETVARMEFKSKAALNPIYGRVLAVGLHCEHWKMPIAIAHLEMFKNGEKEMIEYVLNLFESCLKNGGRIIGYNIMNFDLPFLCKRAYKFGIPIPKILLTQMGMYAPTLVVDVMHVWGCGNKRDMVKLDDLAKFFGTTRKNGDGAMFHKLYFESQKSRQNALAYLENDIIMTLEISEKLGIVPTRTKIPMKNGGKR